MRSTHFYTEYKTVQLLNMARTLPITDDITHSDQAISDEAPLVSMTVSDRYLCVSFAGLDSVRQMHLRGNIWPLTSMFQISYCYYQSEDAMT